MTVNAVARSARIAGRPTCMPSSSQSTAPPSRQGTTVKNPNARISVNRLGEPRVSQRRSIGAAWPDRSSTAITGRNSPSQDYAALCRRLGVAKPMGAVGTSADNAACGSFHASLKRETLQGAPHYGDAATCRRTVFRRLTRYNTRKRHSAEYVPAVLGYECHADDFIRPASPDVYRFSYHLCGDQLAEDVAQETLLRGAGEPARDFSGSFPGPGMTAVHRPTGRRRPIPRGVVPGLSSPTWPNGRRPRRVRGCAWATPGTN